jgi:LacI family transcriptional regulator
VTTCRVTLADVARRAGASTTIGFVCDTMAGGQFAGDMIRGALDEASERSCGLVIVEAHGDTAMGRAMIEGMLDGRAGGVIYAAMSTRPVTLPRGLRGRPVVLLNCLAEDPSPPMVVPDEFNAGRDAARLLIEAGHEDGVYVVGGRHRTGRTPEGVYAGWERMRGVERVMREAGLRLAGVCECAWHSPRHGYREVRALLAAGRRPRALICCNDRLAMGAYQALGEAGLAVGGDVSVVSFDSSGLGGWLRPRLTSIALPYYELGRSAVRALLGGCAVGFTPVPMPVALGDSVRGGHTAGFTPVPVPVAVGDSARGPVRRPAWPNSAWPNSAWPNTVLLR